MPSFFVVRLFRIKRGVLIAVPEVTRHRVETSIGLAFLVLGSDGLWGTVTEDKVGVIKYAGGTYTTSCP